MRAAFVAVLISAFLVAPCFALDAPVNHEGKLGDPAISQNIWAAQLYRWYRDCQATGDDENSPACRKVYAVEAILDGMYPVDAIIANPNASRFSAAPSSRQGEQGMKWFIVGFWITKSGQQGAFVNTARPFDSLNECDAARAAFAVKAGVDPGEASSFCAGNPAVASSMKRMFPDDFKN